MTSQATWPPLGYGEHTWNSSGSATWSAGAERDADGERYQAAVVPAIAGLVPLPSAATRQLAEEAQRELTRFDAELGPRASAFAPLLLRAEAASSSQLENLTAPARAIFVAELGVHTSSNARDVAANTQAMRVALDRAGDLTAESIRRWHAVLMEHHPRHTLGQWRDQPVWIGTRSESPVGATYVAPPSGHVPALMDDFVSFSKDLAVPPLVSVAVAHAQFETIHPFCDGNGRTGRAMAQAMLRERGVTRNVAVPVSAGLLADVEGYHEALTAYRVGDVDPIIEAFAAASLRAVHNARQLITDIDEVRHSWDLRLKARRHSNAWKLLDILARRPVLNSATAASELAVQQPNVYPPLRALVQAGIAESKSEHQLGPFWRSDEVLDAIDAFMARTGRRSAM